MEEVKIDRELADLKCYNCGKQFAKIDSFKKHKERKKYITIPIAIGITKAYTKV